MTDFLADVRLSIRSMRRSPGFYFLVLGILGLGIGASVSVFTLVDGVVLRPLPYRDPSRLIALKSIATKPPYDANGSVTYDDYEQIRKQTRFFENVAVMYRDGWSRVVLTNDGQRERLRGSFVSPEFFDLFGRAPLAGRFFTSVENLSGANVLLIGERMAVRRFGSVESAVGRDLELSGRKWLVIGVMASDFRVPFLDVQLWAPVMSHPEWIDRQEPNATAAATRWEILARLKPGASLAAAQSEIDAIYRRQIEKLPASHWDGLQATPLRDYFTRDVRKPFAILLFSVGFLLLIACANVGNLLLARAASRRNEFAIRAALGAGVGRLLRQAIAETTTVCLAAGAVGVALSFWLVRVMKVLAPGGTPRLDEVTIDYRVLAFATALSVGMGLLLGVGSVWSSLRQVADPNRGTRNAARGITGGREGRKLKNVLVASEFSLAMVLLTGAVLLIRSFVAILGVDLGFRPEHLLTLHVEFPEAVPAPQQSQFYQDAMDGIRRIPGVAAAGATSFLFTGSTRTHALRIVEGHAPEPIEKWGALEWSQISGDYFQTLGIPLLRGRYFNQHDSADAPPVVMVNETAARRYWPGEDPVGKRLKGYDPRGPNHGKNDDWLTVVGVVRDIRAGGRERHPIGQIYEVQAQRGEETPMIIVRTSGDPVLVTASVRSAIQLAGRPATVSSVKTVEKILDDDQVQRRFQTWLIGVFSAVALTLAALGVFAVMHFAVAAKTREIGVRMAVGARAVDILALVLGDGARLAIAGIATGAIASTWVTDALAAMLFQVKPTDAASFASAAGILFLVAVVACYLPARRAARLDPITALREE
jgi:predicted permease